MLLTDRLLRIILAFLVLLPPDFFNSWCFFSVFFLGGDYQFM